MVDNAQSRSTPSSFSLAVIPGDGIGSEVAEALETAAKELVNLLPPRPRAPKRINLPLVGSTLHGGHHHH